MPVPSSTPNRKRSRAQIVEDDELDELSPQKSSRTNPTSASTKRRKLAKYTSSSTKKGLLGSLGSWSQKLAGGIFGGAQDGKENGQEDQHIDELAEAKDMWDVLSTDDEREKADRSPIKEKASAKRTVKALSHDGKAKSRRKSLADQLRIDMVGHGSGEETPRRSSKSKKVAEPDSASNSVSAKITNGDDSTKKKLGRPSRKTLLKNAKAQAREDKRKELGVVESDSNEQEESTQKFQQRRNGSANNESLPPSDSEQAIPSSVKIKTRRELDRLGIDMVDSPMSSRKGILSPSKKFGTVQPQKSVTFRRSDEDLNLGFKDMPTSADSKRARIKTQKALESTMFIPKRKSLPPASVKEGSESEPLTESGDEAEEEEEVDIEEPEDRSLMEETACSICAKLDSRKGNQILLCDGCDLAVHQKCYSVPVIPKGDWYCRDCKTHSGVIQEIKPSDLPDIEGFEDHLKMAQRLILDRLTGQSRIKLCGHDDQSQKVHQIVEQTVLAGEGNSMLVIGARGSGKTTLVESVISDMSNSDRDKFHVVRLNGFIHTDDKLASREIWRQLGREMELEEDSVKTSNHADTMASLLALLSHPAELSDESSSQTAKSVIFVLDEFDLFTTHSRQTLLYNLFDIAQARKAPIAVLGLTTRIDVVESLEKRVKSRFSHRYVYLSHPRSPPNFWEICRTVLTISPNETGSGPSDFSTPGQIGFVAFWNAMVEDLYSKDDDFKSHLQSQFCRTKSVPTFLASCIMPVATLSSKNFPLKGKAFVSGAMSLGPPDSKLQMLQGLSELELSLLIAAARLDIILDTDTCNFAMVYDEYSSLTSRHKIQTSSTGLTAMGSGAKVWGRDIALGAWEKLAEYEVLVPMGIGGGRGQDSGASGRMWKVDVGLEEIAGSVHDLSGVMSKWCREI